jgi:hypothetical protein
MTADAHAAPIGDGLREALHATAADPARSDELRLFGQFVGSWTLDWAGTDRATSMRGELHEGRRLAGEPVIAGARGAARPARSRGLRAGR